MTITISDAALGLAETTCGILMVGCVVVVLFYSVVAVIRDGQMTGLRQECRALRGERDRLMMDTNVAEMEAAKWKRDFAEYFDRIEYAIAVLRGEDEEGEEETS